MSSVTQRIRKIKQPKGGYVKPSSFQIEKLDDGKILSQQENIHGSIIGTVVDSLTRFILCQNIVKAFEISLQGVKIASKMGDPTALETAYILLTNIKGNDETSIVCACKLATFDVWFRNTFAALTAKGADSINPDPPTIRNIQIMVQRSVSFFEKYGPVVAVGFTFEKAGYTRTVDSGDGDFLTEDTLWDFKVLKSRLTSKHTLQLLMYWIMGQHSGKEIFKGISNIGIFNPRFNMVYTLNVLKIDKRIIREVEENIICYPTTFPELKLNSLLATQNILFRKREKKLWNGQD